MVFDTTQRLLLAQWAVALVVIPLLQIVYRLVLHPLARFPGPKLAAMTKWYEFYFDICKSPGGQFAEEIRRMHKVYGPIIRINPDELHVEDPEWYDTLYASNPTRRDKWPAAAKMVGTPLAGFGTVEHTVHGKRRAALSPLFSSRSIVDAGDVMKEQIEILCRRFGHHHKTKEPIGLRTAFMGFTLDIVSVFALGESMGLQHDMDRARGWVDMLKAVSKITPMAKQFPWLISWGQKLPLGILRVIDPTMAGLLQVHEVSTELLHLERTNDAEDDFAGYAYQGVSISHRQGNEKARGGESTEELTSYASSTF
ncbi:MAG: hypothetical protein Q9176_006468 [Flavoplaca citrina]